MAARQLTDRADRIDRAGVGRTGIGNDGHGHYAGPLVGGGPLYRVMGLTRCVHADRPIDPLRRHVVPELLERELPRCAERQQVGRGAAAAVHALHRTHPAQAGEPLQGYLLAQMECSQGVALGRGDIRGGRGQGGSRGAAGRDEGAEPGPGHRCPVRNDVANQLCGELLNAHADLGQRNIQLLAPPLAGMQGVGMLEFQELIECRPDPAQVLLQMTGLGRIGFLDSPAPSSLSGLID
jgi:hypothetical protein